MLFVTGFAAFLILVVWVYCVFDVIASEEASIRNLPKIVWLLVVILLPTIGSLAWLLLGRPERAGAAPGATTYRRRPPKSFLADRAPRDHQVAPDDDPRLLAEIEKRAEQLKRRDDGSSTSR